MIELHPIGFIQKAHGKSGQVRIHVEEDFITDLQSARAVFIYINGSQVPFLIEGLEITNHLLLKLDEVDEPEATHMLLGCKLSLEIKDITTEHKPLKAVDLERFEGYRILDHYGQPKGQITSIEVYPQQLMANIENECKPFLLPLHEDIILEINDSIKCIKVQWPDGLDAL